MTAQLLQILVLALVPIGAVRVTVPTFYALGDTKTLVYAASASLATTLGLGFTWVGAWEIHGLTAAISVAALVQSIVLSFWLRHRLKRETGIEAMAKSTNDISLTGHALRCLIAVTPSGLMVAYFRDSYDWLEGPNLMGVLTLGALGLTAGLIYLLMAKLLRIRDVDLIIGIVKRRIHR